MKLEKFYSLQKRFENRRFESAQKWTALILYYGSYLGNILSIILSFFFVNHLAGQAAVHFAGQEIVLPIFIILFLTIFEFAKRFTFANTITTFLTVKKRTASFFGGLVFVGMLVAGTFYLSLSGANTYANKTEIITTTTEVTINTQVDSLTKRFKEENDKLEARITYLYSAAETRKNKSLKPIEVDQVKGWEASIANNNKSLEVKIAEIKANNNLKADQQKDQSGDSQFAFLLLSGFIEILILIGVGFKEYYEYNSFKEQKESLEGNANFQKLIIYEGLLRTLYNNGKTGINASLPSANAFKELVSASGKKHPQKTIKEFLQLCNSLKITQVIGKSRITSVNYEKALDILQNYLPVDDNG